MLVKLKEVCNLEFPSIKKYAKDLKKSAVVKHQMKLDYKMDFEKASVKLCNDCLLKRKILKRLIIKRNLALFGYS